MAFKKTRRPQANDPLASQVPAGYRPVSYTHLDVYKRQMLFLSVAFAFYFFDISLVFQDEFIVRSCGDCLLYTSRCV